MWYDYLPPLQNSFYINEIRLVFDKSYYSVFLRIILIGFLMT